MEVEEYFRLEDRQDVGILVGPGAYRPHYLQGRFFLPLQTGNQ